MSAHINEIQTVGNVQYELLAFFNREEEKGIQGGTVRFVQAEKTHCFFKKNGYNASIELND